MEDEGNSSLLPPSDIKSKKEQPEMLSEFDRRFVLPQFDMETNETKSEMWSGDCRVIKAGPLRMLPPQEAETFLVEERPRTSLKYYGGIDQASQSAKTPQTSTKRGKATRDFDFANPPEKLTWVLTDADNGEWNPYFEGIMVPEKLKNEWVKEFHSVCGNM